MPRRSNAPVSAFLIQLGQRVQLLRQKADITQERLAENMDVHPRTMQKIERGQVNMPTTTLIRLRAALGCRWNDLLPPDA